MKKGAWVFFCGAGISYPARLPEFGGLVAKLYGNLAPFPSAVQQAAIKSEQYDTAVGLLEAEGGRERVRRNMASILTPDLSSPKATATHKALLNLARTSELDRLVNSSGDFGLAYLTERWAARFVSELFRNYTVCFVGYSIADPVLRYMMDALAADRLLGELSPEMFAFGSYSRGEEKD